MDRLLPPGGALGDEDLERLYGFPEPLDRPWVKVNFVSSIDGAVSVGGRAHGLSDPNDQRILHLGRELADVILVGAGTVLVERYSGIKPGAMSAELRARHGLSAIPRIAVVTRRCSIDPSSPLITSTVVPPLVITVESAPEDRRDALTEAGAEVVLAGADAVDLPTVLAELDGRKLRRVTCEGGPHLFGSLITAGLVDEMCLSVSPLLVGGGGVDRIAAGPAPGEPVRMRLDSVLHADDLLMLRYLRR